MSEELRTRIRNRLSELDLKPAQLDKAAGLSVGYTLDFLSGRKRQPRAKNLERIAEVLDCDLAYLLLEQKTPRKGELPTDGLMLAGNCAVGVWRSTGDVDAELVRTAYERDPRFPDDPQAVYFVQDGHAAGLGIPQDSYLTTVLVDGMKSLRPAKANDVVVIVRYQDKLIEISVARLKMVNGKLSAIRKGEKKQETVTDFDIEAIVLTATKNFM